MHRESLSLTQNGRITNKMKRNVHKLLTCINELQQRIKELGFVGSLFVDDDPNIEIDNLNINFMSLV